MFEEEKPKEKRNGLCFGNVNLPDGSEFSLLSQLSSSSLPAMSSSQVSSVLSALEEKSIKKTIEVIVDKSVCYKCPSCQFLSVKSDSVALHRSQVHDDSEVEIESKCIACQSSIYKTSQSLKFHYIFDHNVQLSEVDELMRVTEEVNRKSKSEPKEVNRKCGAPGCSVKFVSESNVIYHRRCHSGNEYNCPECSTSFTAWPSLSNHLWKSHGIDLELYSCDECPFKTNSLSKLLNLHRRIHKEERPFLCDVCAKGFKTKKQLKNHKLIHRKRSKSVDCRLCSRTFSDPRMLNNHVDYVHKGLRPFLCSICGHTAASRSSLKMHHRSHTGEKPYQCNECDYTTSDHNSLRRHRMRHTGAKHYKCPHCPYACIQSTTFKAHLNNKHPGMDDGLMFSCSLCPFKTVKKDNFLTHTSYHTINEKVKVGEDFSLEEVTTAFKDRESATVEVVGSVDTEVESSSNYLVGDGGGVCCDDLVKSEVLINDRMLSESQVSDDAVQGN